MAESGRVWLRYVLPMDVPPGKRSRWTAFHYAAGGCVLLSVAIAAVVFARGEHDAQRLREQIRIRSRMTLVAARDGLEDYLAHVVLTVRAFALHPTVRAMRSDARDYLQALYDGSYDKHQLAEIYIIQRDFDGHAPPFMAFEKGENDESVEETHTLAHELAEYREQQRQIAWFAEHPDRDEIVSPLVDLCVGESGFVYSVPVRAGQELRGIVAGMIAADRLMGRIASSGLRERFELMPGTEAGIPSANLSEVERNGIAAALQNRSRETGLEGIEEFQSQDERVYVAALHSEAFRHWKLAMLETELPGEAALQGFLTSGVIGVLIVLLGGAAGYLLLLTPRLIQARRDAERAGRQERELAHAARLATAGQMTTGLAHELNQPLTAIVNYAHALRERAARAAVEPAELSAGLTQIQAQAARAGEIVRYVRDFVRKSPGTRRAVDLNTLVNETVDFLRAGETKRDVRITFELEAGGLRVRVDRVAIQQVLINLLRNAEEALAEARSPEPEINIHTGHSGAVAYCEVADNGLVLGAADAERMFRPFQSAKPDGLGIGLALSRSIVEAHDGTLSATARAPRGVSFRFTLPLMRESDASP